MCVLLIKVPIRKKSGNLFNDPRTFLCSCFFRVFCLFFKQYVSII